MKHIARLSPLLLPVLAQAATIYVSPSGTGDGFSADSPAALSSTMLLAAATGGPVLVVK